MRGSIIILFTLLFFMWIPLSQEAPGEFLIDSYDGIVNADVVIYDNQPSPTTYSSYGQTFQPSSDCFLTKAQFELRRSTPLAGSGVWKAYLYAHNGTFGVDGKPIGEPLAESTSINHDDLPTGEYVMQTFLFSGTFQLQANTPYCIVTYSLDVPFDAAVWARIGGSTLKEHEGTGVYYHAGAWKSPSSKDIFFYVYGENPDGAQQNISGNLQLAAALMIGLFIVVFVVHMIYMIERGSGEKFLDLLLGYVVCAIIICALAIFIVSIGG